MSRKALVFRRVADQDVEDALDWYASNGGIQLAIRLNGALRSTFRAIRDYPALGSTRYGDVLKVSGLRSRLVKGFPYVVLYVAGSGTIEI